MAELEPRPAFPAVAGAGDRSDLPPDIGAERGPGGETDRRGGFRVPGYSARKAAIGSTRVARWAGT